MKRRTNIFYSEGPDSKFLTFSNYTESLTGNFLSTDTKLYPSTFLCLNIESLLDENNKKEFIEKWLMGYYENKLAFLRDTCINNNKNPENKILPLQYLLETINKYIASKSGEEETEYNYISYVGDITEQDYNGTYTDTICIIDFNNAKEGKIVIDNSDNTQINKDYISVEENVLYGWEDNDTIKDKYSTVNFDKIDSTSNLGQYTFKSDITGISLTSKQYSEDKLNIKFNIIIPLFDVTNINYRLQEYVSNSIANMDNIDLTNDPYRKNVPLGIWFSDTPIELYKDSATGFSQSWSLLISSQFKPFPYTNAVKNEISNTSVSNAFPTFAMILSRQNEVLDKFMKLSNEIEGLKGKLEAIETKISNSSAYNLDSIKREFINYQYEMNNKYNNLSQDIKQILDQIAWNVVMQ